MSATARVVSLAGVPLGDRLCDCRELAAALLREGWTAGEGRVVRPAALRQWARGAMASWLGGHRPWLSVAQAAAVLVQAHDVADAVEARGLVEAMLEVNW